MDTARVVHSDAEPVPGPRRRHRWALALVLAGLAAPLTSGSAIALSGGGGTQAAPAQSAPLAPVQHYGGRHDCHGKHGFHGTAAPTGRSL